MNDTFIIDMIMIFIISIFVLGHIFIISLFIVDSIEKHKKQKEIKCKNKYSGHYKIMAPKLDSIDKACYDLTPELYYTYGIGMDFKHVMARFKRGTAFNLLPSAKCYFVEMHELFLGLTRHLNNNAKLFIDLGDSIFGGVHIPTDLILNEVLGGIGYRFDKRIVLRERRSRNNEIIVQVLLKYTYNV